MRRDVPLRAWFTPGLIGLHLLVVLAVAVCVGMGLWQAGVYDHRRADEQGDKREVPTVAFDGDLWGPDEPFTSTLNHRPVRVTGTFAPTDQQVWVTGKDQGERTGAWLVAPLLVGTGDNALMVVRGWSPEAGDLPAVPQGPVTIDAVLEPGEATDESFDPATRTIGSVRIPALLNVIPHDLYSGFAISTDQPSSGGLELVPPPQPGDVSWTVGLRNLAYAIQWWVFGLFSVFMWWRMSTESIETSRAKVA